MSNGRRAALALLGSLAVTTPDAAGQSAPAGEPVAAPGQVVLVTGSTDGLGREVARRLAASGAHVIIHGRNHERGAALVEEITRAGSGSAAFYPADLGSLEQVRELAAAVVRDHDRIDVLVNNAGIWLTRGDRSLSEDGHELHFAVNYLSGYLLTRLLLPALTSAAPARIVNVASAAQAPIDFTNVMLQRDYSGSRAYAQSKLAQVLFTIDLAAELSDRNIIVVALHPATLMNTPMVSEAGVRARSTVEEGAEAVMQLITSPDIVSGSYYNGLRSERAHAQAYDAAARAQLRTLSEALTRIP